MLDQNYINLKNQVIKAERRVLKELGFCVHVKHPHKVCTLTNASFLTCKTLYGLIIVFFPGFFLSRYPWLTENSMLEEKLTVFTAGDFGTRVIAEDEVKRNSMRAFPQDSFKGWCY